MPSHLLTTTLSDLLHAPPPPASSVLMSLERPLAQGHHLVYFPLQTAASGLAVDGADRDHAPSEEFTKRLWAGGEVRFRDWDWDWEDGKNKYKDKDKGFMLDGRAWVCKEEIGDVKVKGGGRGDEKVFVDLWRRYGLGHEAGGGGGGGGREWDVEERRTLVFMRKLEEEAVLSSAAAAAATRIIKCECETKQNPPIHDGVERD